MVAVSAASSTSMSLASSAMEFAVTPKAFAPRSSSGKPGVLPSSLSSSEIGVLPYEPLGTSAPDSTYQFTLPWPVSM